MAIDSFYLMKGQIFFFSVIVRIFFNSGNLARTQNILGKGLLKNLFLFLLNCLLSASLWYRNNKDTIPTSRSSNSSNGKSNRN